MEFNRTVSNIYLTRSAWATQMEWGSPIDANVPCGHRSKLESQAPTRKIGDGLAS